MEIKEDACAVCKTPSVSSEYVESKESVPEGLCPVCWLKWGKYVPLR